MTTIDYKEKYEQALERARQFSEKPYLEDSAGIVEYIFPELNESEDDRIRDEIISAIEEDWPGHTDWIAWLKKQSEIIKEWSEMKFNNIQRELQEMVDLKQKTKQCEQNTNHKNMIVKFICKKDWHGIGDYCCGKIYNGYPCEKEQKGYDIYDDNHIPTFCDEDFINEYFTIIEEKQGEQNPYGQRKESEDERTWIINYLSNRELNSSIIAEKENLKKAIAWLEKQAEQKVAIDNTVWSKEDEEQFSFCCAAIELSNYSSDEHRNYAISFLESLKDRIQHQNRWKPSDAQMASITCAVRKMKESACYDSELISLFNDLKKLKG